MRTEPDRLRTGHRCRLRRPRIASLGRHRAVRVVGQPGLTGQSPSRVALPEPGLSLHMGNPQPGTRDLHPRGLAHASTAAPHGQQQRPFLGTGRNTALRVQDSPTGALCSPTDAHSASHQRLGGRGPDHCGLLDQLPKVCLWLAQRVALRLRSSAVDAVEQRLGFDGAVMVWAEGGQTGVVSSCGLEAGFGIAAQP